MDFRPGIDAFSVGREMSLERLQSTLHAADGPVFTAGGLQSGPGVSPQFIPKDLWADHFSPARSCARLKASLADRSSFPWEAFGNRQLSRDHSYLIERAGVSMYACVCRFLQQRVELDRRPGGNINNLLERAAWMGKRNWDGCRLLSTSRDSTHIFSFSPHIKSFRVEGAFAQRNNCVVPRACTS